MDRGAWYLVGPLMGAVIVAMLWATNRPLGALDGYIDLQGCIPPAGWSPACCGHVQAFA